MRLSQITPRFVDEIPRTLDPGVLYICCHYRATKHLCACGCGVEVNTPLHPTAWTLTCDGVSVSLSPSIGNWSEKCQSHYWITNNRIHWASRLSRHRIRQVRKARESDREYYYNKKSNLKAGHKGENQFLLAKLTLHYLTKIWHWILRRQQT